MSRRRVAVLRVFAVATGAFGALVTMLDATGIVGALGCICLAACFGTLVGLTLSRPVDAD